MCGTLRAVFERAFLFNGPREVDVSRPNLSLCDASMADIRRRLSMPSPEHCAWASITKAHRVYLLMASGLCADRQVDGWSSFSDDEQTKITEQVRIGGALAKRWTRLRWND